MSNAAKEYLVHLLQINSGYFQGFSCLKFFLCKLVCQGDTNDLVGKSRQPSPFLLS